MIKKTPKSRQQIDGIVTRNRRSSIDDFSKGRQSKSDTLKLDTFSDDNIEQPQRDESKVEADFEIDFNDLEKAEKEQITQSKKRWWQRSSKMKSSKKMTKKRLFRRFALFAGAAALVLGFFLGSRLFFAARNIIDRSGSCPAVLCGGEDASLRGEGDGRVNIMVVGIGGAGHDGGDLADTIIIASLDPFENEVALLSVPRDMYVDVPEYGSTRINAAHAYGEEFGFSEADYPADGIGLLQKTIEQTLDIPIHYYIRGDFKGFEQAVDTVDGVTVNVTESVYDNNFWQALGGPLDVPEGQQTFDGRTALFYARSRYTSSRGDFSRNERQRDILIALKDKALSVGTLSDPTKLVGLINAAGSHVRTNIQPAEILRIYEIMSAVTADKTISVGIDTGENNYLTTATIDGAAVLVPKAGDYSDVKRYVRSVFVDGYIRNENAEVAVLNGSETLYLASTKSEELTSFGYNVTNIDLAPTQDYPSTVIYDLSSGDKKFTKEFLEQRFSVTMLPGTSVPSGIDIAADFLIILGNNETLESEITQN